MTLAALPSAPARGADAAARAQADVGRAVAVEAAAQAELDGWARERENLLAEARRLDDRVEWLGFEEKRYDAYLARQERTLAELERRRSELARIRRELDPWLWEVAAQLETQVRADLPFLPEERERRLRFLHESLEDYSLGPAEKLRRVFEALKAEAEYGRTVDATEQTLVLAGGETRVTVFRLGRLGLFYLTADGRGAGRWSRVAGGWEALPSEYAPTVLRAVEMAERKRAAELLDLPLEVAR
ncbi:MAG: DUF3450 domain-containing protein [Desulfovibrionaceae bacterium]|nr:DUF3450 domain-containing protein [Desulfovibrionaceae bacterium]